MTPRRADRAGSRRNPPARWASAAWIVLALLLLLGVVAAAWRLHGTDKLLIAPMPGGLDGCVLGAHASAPAVDPAFAAACSRPGGSAADLIEATLRPLQPPGTARSRDYELGYTLNVPLLRLLQPTGDGWSVDPAAVERVARTIGQVQRPVVLYLFANHFSVDAPAEPALARDSANLLSTPAGPLPPDQYYGAPVYPWTFADADAPITRHRLAATQAVLDAVCRLPAAARERVQAVTLLGEVHHLFPYFETGMGFGTPYASTDYSAASRRGFRRFLAERYGSVAALNAALGADYPAFDAVDPPSKDIRRHRLGRYHEHIDAQAGGTLTVSGWVHAGGAATDADTAWVRVLVDGREAARVPARYGREDVRAALPGLPTANVGWSAALPYAGWGFGQHRIDALLELPGGGLALLGSRTVSVMDRTQSTPPVAAAAPLPALGALPAAVRHHLDHPPDRMALFFNPLVVGWHAFRSHQVAEHLGRFAERVGASCLGGARAYSHQILPFSNPDWDPAKFGLDATLGVPASLALGISLYGEAGYGTSFFDWLAASGRKRYGVTEFHPLQPLDAAALDGVLQRHRAHGARFVSFFVNAAGSGARNSAVQNPFTWDPGNPVYGSDHLYRATATLLGGSPARPRP